MNRKNPNVAIVLTTKHHRILGRIEEEKFESSASYSFSVEEIPGLSEKNLRKDSFESLVVLEKEEFDHKNHKLFKKESSISRLALLSCEPLTRVYVDTNLSNNSLASITDFSIIEYFVDDFSDLKKLASNQNKLFYHEHTVHISLTTYFEFFLFHILAYVVLGPFITVYALVCWERRYLLINTMFLSIHYITIMQYLTWVSNTLIYIHSLRYSAIGISDIGTLLIVAISQFLRAGSIAGIYSSFPDNKIKKLKTIRLTKSEISQNWMLSDWFNQDPMTIENEVINSMKRLEIDNAMLIMSFINPVSSTARDDFANYYSSFTPNFFSKKSKRSYGLLDIEYFDGKLIFTHLLSKFNKQYNYSKMRIFCAFVLSLICSSTPTIVRAAFKQSIHGERPIEIIVFYVNSFTMFCSIFLLSMFIERAFVDLRRRHYMLQQLGQIMSPKKLSQYSSKKILPTINLFDQLSQRAWVSLRKMTIDYGSRFLIRHMFMILLLFLLASGTIGTCIFLHFGKEPFHTEPTEEISKLKIVLLVYFSIFFSIAIWLMYIAAQVNSHFGKHAHIIKSNKEIYHDLVTFKSIYFKQHIKGHTSIEDNIYKVKNIIRRDSKSFIHIKLSKDITLLLGHRISYSLTLFLDGIIEQSSKLIEVLEEDESFNCLRLFGIEFTGVSVTNLIMAYASIIATSIEFLTS